MAAPFRSRNSTLPRRAARPCLELLEPRLVLSGSPTIAMVGDTLTVEGTPGPDRIRIVPTQLAGTFRVVFNGREAGSFGPAAKLDVDAGGGNDTVTVDPRATLPTQLDGGAGNDVIRGGSGPNFLNGGVGRNTLIGNPIRDTFDDDSGENRLVFVKSLGVIQVAPSVSGAALRALAGSYTLAPLRVAGPVVVDAASLGTPKIARLLKNNYEGGQPVALANATAEGAAALASLLGVPNPAVFPADASRLDLLTFRKTNQGDQALFSTSILSPRAAGPDTPWERAAGNRAVRSYLNEVFSATPTVPPRPQLGAGQTDLTQIANAYQTTTLFPLRDGLSIQVHNIVYGARSFTNGSDYYLVIQELDVTNGSNPLRLVGSLVEGVVGLPPSGTGIPLLNSPSILEPSPQSNPGTVTITTGGSVTVGGSIGVNEAQGFNAQINASVTIANSASVAVPPISISYRGDLLKGLPSWYYFYNNPPQPGEATTFIAQWVWQVPFNHYPPGYGAALGFPFAAVYSTTADPPGQGWKAESGTIAQAPFGMTYQIADPVVTGVSTPTVQPGGVFTIQGTGFYPSLVQDVLIGGRTLDAANYITVSDKEIRVIAPNTPGTALPVTVRTTQDFSNSNVTITIGGTSQLHVQAQPVAAVAGQPFTSRTVANFTASDSNARPADFAAKIDWGDGSTSDGTVTAAGPGTFNVLGAHTYATAGAYTFNIQVTDPAGNKATSAGTATVAAPDTGGPQNLVAQPVAAVAGQAFTNVTVATFADSVLGVSPADFTAAITWGDGTSTPSTTVTLAGPGTFNVLGTHTYLAPGTYPFNVQVTDNKGRKVTANGTATVANA